MSNIDYHVKMGESVWFRHKDPSKWDVLPENLWECDSVSTSQNMRCHIIRYEFSVIMIGSGKSVLDLACGTGYGCDMIQKVGNDVTGVDYDDTLIQHCKKFYPRCKFVQCNMKVDNLPFENNTFDFINGHAFLDWDVYGTSNLFNEVYRILKFGGHFLVSSNSVCNYIGVFDKFKNIRVFQQVGGSIIDGFDKTISDIHQYHIYLVEK